MSLIRYPILILVLVFFSGSMKGQKPEYLIGFSQCTSDDTWRETMEREMEIELSLYPELDFIKTDANGNSQQQVDDVKYLLSQGIDILIISPNESEPLTGIVEEVYQEGIPVIVIDRQINSEEWSAYIGADNYEIGRQAGEYASLLLNGKGTIVEITGLEGSSPALARQKGFDDGLSGYPEINILASVTGKWNWAEGKLMMDSLLNAGIEPDLVFSHNDFMAAGAYEATLEKGLEKHLHFIGIDGLPGEEGGIQYVIDGKLDATFLYPTGGDKAIDVARKILLGQDFDRNTKLQTLLIDERNATTLKLQNEQLASLQAKIQRQREIAGRYLEQISTLRMGTMLISGFALVVVLLILVIIRAYRNKQRTNLELEKQKRKIEKQNKKLKKISKKLEIATQQKLRFFTNISHEFRTPLTLMTGPLESMILRDDLPNDVRKQMEMMYRNALRLLRLINQIMDFRKLENDKMQLNAGEYDIIAFIRKIKETFSTLAEKQKIKLELETDKPSLKVWFDTDKIDKVMFNLLSNAFKFTAEYGRICVRVSEIEKTINDINIPLVRIDVEDDGRGMSEEHINRIFDRFYQIEQQREGNYFPGTGLGLSLSKGLIELHSGQIEVASKKGEGTTFSIYLRLGDDHLDEKDKLIAAEHSSSDMFGSEKMISEELQYFPTISEIDTTEEGVPVRKDKKEYLVLVVDDNLDLLKYMKESLVGEYDILTAKNGEEAWEIVQHDLPDLVISDVMMPNMDGLELTRHIKTDMRTCHIPVIMLTAKISIESKLEGLEAGADSYIPKPFNDRHLVLRVRKLLEMRKRISDHYRENLSFEAVENPVARMDQRFLDRTAKVIEDHILDQAFGVVELSGEVAMSRVHLYRKIKQITGMSVSEYIRTVKLKLAKDLLRKGDMTIAEVAYASGFTSPSYFTKCFKQQFSHSPSDYLSQFTDDRTTR